MQLGVYLLTLNCINDQPTNGSTLPVCVEWRGGGATKETGKTGRKGLKEHTRCGQDRERSFHERERHEWGKEGPY